MPMQRPPFLKKTTDEEELHRFEKISSDWWNPKGKFHPLHALNPVRLSFICNHIANHFDRDLATKKPFQGISFLDIGCGGGLLSEPMARLGGEITGIDPVEKNIIVAREHAKNQGLDIDYQIGTAEELLSQAKSFDVVLNMEVVEHVHNVEFFIGSITKMIKAEGLLFTSTINKTLQSFLLAIIMAEYILQWLPRGTHHFNKLIPPEDLKKILLKEQLSILDEAGFHWNPCKKIWYINKNTDVNYIILAKKNHI